jgi:hypothetical protein
MPDAPPQPVKLAISADALQSDFIRVTMDRIADPAWQYALVLRKNVMKIRPNDGLTAPTPGDPVQSVGLLYREDVEADFEIYGVRLRFEIDPANWLDHWLRYNGVTPAAMLRWPLPGGVSGDAVAEWTIDGVRFAGRFATFKSGSRLFVVCCRAKREIYEKVADDFFLALTQFKLVQTDPTPIAEPVRVASGLSPVPWKLLVPASWAVTALENQGPGGTIQAAAQPPADRDAGALSASTAFFKGERTFLDPSTWNAQISASLAPHSLIEGWSGAEDLCTSTLRDAGLELEERVFEKEDPMGPFEESKFLSTPARLRGVPGADVRCRVARVGPVWFVSAGVGVIRAVNPHAWMRNVRAHDLLAQAVELEL